MDNNVPPINGSPASGDDSNPLVFAFDFDKEVDDLVKDTAPRMVAVVSEWTTEDGERDACVAAWGLEYEDGHLDVLPADGRALMSLGSAERAEWWFTKITGGPVHLRWVTP